MNKRKIKDRKKEIMQKVIKYSQKIMVSLWINNNLLTYKIKTQNQKNIRK